jgi:hypothetical protein
VGGTAEPPTAETLNGILLDEMYPPALAQRLRDKGHNVVAVLDVEVGLASRSDDDVLARAAGNDRCVITEKGAEISVRYSTGVSCRRSTHLTTPSGALAR